MCLVKFTIEVYGQQKNMYKIFDGSVVTFVFQNVFYFEIH